MQLEREIPADPQVDQMSRAYQRLEASGFTVGRSFTSPSKCAHRVHSDGQESDRMPGLAIAVLLVASLAGIVRVFA